MEEELPELEEEEDPSLSSSIIILRNRLNTCQVPRDTYSLLVTEAYNINGIDESIVVAKISEIEWLNLDLIQEGIHFLNERFTMVVLADTFALMFGFCVKPMSSVVLRTGKLTNSEMSFRRYLSTVQRIARFFLLPVDESMANEAFQVVRGMHKRSKEMTHVRIPIQENFDQWKVELAEAIRNDLDHIDTSNAPTDLLTWYPKVPLSQFDMAVTQFGFIGVMWSFPNVFGIKDRDNEMRGVIHLWAVIGQQLGLRDEYNVCLHYDPENPQLFHQLYRNVLMESLKTTDESVVHIQNEFMKAYTSRVPFMTYKSMLFYGFREVEGYKGENLWKLMSFKDKIAFQIMRAWFWGMRNCSLYRYFMNIQTGLWLQWQLWRNKLPTLLDMGFRNLLKVLRM